ncbi:MAG: sensor histidine kinase [Candidatus Diapherotrites archaeon]|nr:sensor histidine kinase [Candidatus Diapherotrites archaeon]
MEEGAKKKSFFFGSIRKKLIIAFATIILIACVTGFTMLFLFQQEINKNIGENSVIVADHTMQNIDKSIYQRLEQTEAYAKDLAKEGLLLESNTVFDSMENRVQYIAEKDNEWRTAPEATVTPFMREIIENDLSQEIREEFLLEEFYTKKYGYPVFAEVFLTNKYGANVAQSNKTSDYYQADEEWWQKARENGFFVEYAGLDESAGVLAIEISSRLADDEGNFLGVLKTVLNAREVFRIIDYYAETRRVNGEGKHQTQHIELIEGNGKVVYSTKTDFEESKSKDFLEKIFYGEEDYFFYGSNPEELIAHAHSNGFYEFDGLSWFLTIGHERSEIMQPLQEIINLVLALIAVGICVAFGFSFLFSKNFSKPIKNLQAATGSIEKGDFSARAKIRTGDEIEELGDAFNRAAAALEKMDEEHKQLEHAKTEFLSITSHELRSPMTPMRAQLQMLKEKYFGPLNKKQIDAIEIVLRNTERLDNIIQDFLEISRIEAARLKFRFKKTSLKPHIEGLVSEMNGFLPEKNIKIETKIGELPEIECDPDRILQVLRNLVNNAKKFSPENTAITITAQLKGEFIECSVQDKGIGIKPENQPKIFEPFFQEEQTMYRKYGGTGLGLSICRGIIESQKGEIWLESTPGRGTTFYFTVPLTPVKEIKPIKLLFSKQGGVEKKLEKLFKELLGPMGGPEFNLLQRKGGIEKQKLLNYLELLIKKSIITKEQGKTFKKRVRELMENRGADKK